MLRLWPEVIEVGLFPGECWLRRGTQISRAECGPGIAQQLEALRDLLAGEKRPFRRFSRADIFISDSHAQLTLLPWQANLRTQAQVNAYGKACFDAKGMCGDGEWSQHTGFRHFGGQGLATAIPSDLVSNLHGLLEEAKVRLRSVVPKSAAAYWYHRPARQHGTSILLFSETSRLTAAIYEDGLLSSFDVEPVLGATHMAANRLEKRVQMRLSSIHHVEVLPGLVQEWARERLREVFGDVVVSPLNGARWNLA